MYQYGSICRIREQPSAGRSVMLIMSSTFSSAVTPSSSVDCKALNCSTSSRFVLSNRSYRDRISHCSAVRISTLEVQKKNKLHINQNYCIPLKAVDFIFNSSLAMNS